MNNFTQLKKSVLLIAFAVFFIGIGVFAQSPNSFKYQAVLRDLDGKVLANKAANVEISILQGSTSGASVITEVFNVTTNMYGLTNLEIGSVNPAAFSSIDWADGPYFIKISVDGDIVGTSQLLSVPYALHAGTVDDVNDADADPSNELQDITLVGNQLTLSMGSTVTLPGTDFDGNYSSLTGTPTKLSDFTNDTGFISNPDDADANPANELQILSIVGNQLTLSDGNTVTLPGTNFDGNYSSLTGAPTNLSDFSNDTGFITNPNDADSNPLNEIQILSISGHKLTLSNGGTVTLPDGFDGMYSSLTGAPVNLSDFANDIGYLTNPNDADADPSNELQNLIKIGNVVSLSNGGGAFVDSALTEAQVDEMVANNGYQSIYELGSMIHQDSISVNIEGGEIDGTVIGLNAPEEGYFQNITVNKNIYLPKTTVDEGVVYVDEKRFIHSKGAHSTYIGEEAGQLAGYGANDNIGVGYKALSNNASGHSNVAVGSGVMVENGIGTQNVAVGQEAMMSNKTGSYNTSMGAYSMTSNTDGSYNIAVGFESLKSNTQGSDNIGVGIRALNNNLVGTGNIAVGYNSMYNNTTGEQNIGIGSLTLYKNTEGENNTATGAFSLNSNTTGNGNVANGHQALYNNTTGSQNVAIGDASLYSNTTAVEITAVGHRSLYSNTTGIGNTAVGARTLNSNTEGYGNTAAGSEVLMDNTTGFDNTGVGLRSLVRNTQGHHNTGVGTAALYDNTEGDYNAALGSEALYNNVFGNYNTAAGFSALYENQEGTNNTAVGNRASNFNAGGDYNTAIGDSAMYNNRPGSYNTALGKEALFMNRTSSTNVAIGAYSMYNQLTGEGNTATGYTALFSNKSGNDNTAMGDSALFKNTNSQNTGIGAKALYSNTGGTGNTGVGSQALLNNATGDENTAVGRGALYNNTVSQNSAFGFRSLYSNTGGFQNVAVGDSSLVANTTGISNTAVGYRSLRTNTTGSYNTALGQNALLISDGDSNTALGDLAGSGLASGGGNLFLGFRAAEDTTSGSNRLFINNDQADLDTAFANNVPPVKKGALIYAEFDKEYMRIDADLDLNGKLAIKNSTQSTAIDTGALTVTGGVGIGRRLNVGEEATFERQVIIGAAAPSISTMFRPTPVSANMLIVDGNASVGSGYINTVAPINGLLVEGNFGLGVPAPAFKMQIDGDIVPSTNGLFTLGAPNLGWDTLYMASTIDYQTDLDFVSAGTKWVSMGTNGNVGIGENLAAPTNVKLHVKGNGTLEGNHMALFENTTSDGDGIAIKVGASTPSNENNFISFLNSSNGVVGRIEGETTVDLLTNPEYIFDNAVFLADIVAAGIDATIAGFEVVQAGVDLTAASTSATGCAGLGACVTAPIPSLIAAASTNLALKIANAVSVGINLTSAIAQPVAYNAFKHTQIGVTYQSGAGDYAEWLPKANKAEMLWPGDVVGVKAGIVSRNTADAENIMVISSQPIVLGNMPEEGKEGDYEKIAFMGQVPVKVRGIVNEGDYILPSGNNDGFGIAVSRENIKSGDYQKIVGIAWSGSNINELNYVNVAVGLNSNDVAGLVLKQEKKIEEQATEIDNLKARLDKMDAILARLDSEYGESVSTKNLKSASIIPEENEIIDDKRTILYYNVTEEQVLDGLANAEEQLVASGVDVDNHPFFMKIKTDPVYKNKYIKDAIQAVEKNIQKFAEIDIKAGESVSIE